MNYLQYYVKPIEFSFVPATPEQTRFLSYLKVRRKGLFGLQSYYDRFEIAEGVFVNALGRTGIWSEEQKKFTRAEIKYPGSGMKYGCKAYLVKAFHNERSIHYVLTEQQWRGLEKKSKTEV